MNMVNVAMVMKAFPILKGMGAQEVIDALYPGVEVRPPEGFDFALEFDCDTLGARADKFLLDVSEMRSNIFGGPMEKAFKALVNKSSSGMKPMTVEYRKTESVFICPADDKITIVFLVDFPDVTDKAIAKVFMQEFVEAQRIVRNAPPVSYSKETPQDLRQVPHLVSPDPAGYISFFVEERHIKGEKNMRKAITLMTGFRNYLHYHIKCTKTYLHMRMRKRVAGWMQVLNRAIPEKEEGEKKTMTGKTFTRK